MQTFNDVSIQQREEYRYHYAALYPLYINAKASEFQGRARLWVRKRWDPQRSLADAEYESITFEMQADNSGFKLEAWVFGNRLIILITDNDDIIKSGLHPSGNYHIDLNDPNSIQDAVKIIDKYLAESQPEVVDQQEELSEINKNVFYYWAAIIAVLTILTFLIRGLFT